MESSLAGASSTAAAVTSTTPTWANNNNNNKLSVVLVGCGQIMTHHVEQMARIGNCKPSNGTGCRTTPDDVATVATHYQVIAVCDPNPTRREIILDHCQRFGLCTSPTTTATTALSTSSTTTRMEFNTLTDFLQYNNDMESNHNSSIMMSTTTKTKDKLILLLALPHYLHETIALEALASGNHVVLEKPLAPTMKSCQILLKASSSSSSQAFLVETNNDDSAANDRTPGMLIVAEQSPFWEEVVLAKSLIQNGEIGTIVSAASYFYESMRDNITSGVDEANGGGLGWRCSMDQAGGGIVLDGGLHWIRPLRELCGTVERVVGVTRCNVQPEMKMEGETLAHAIFQMQPPSFPPCETPTAKDGYGNSARHLIQPLNSGPLFATFSCNAMQSAPMAYDTCPYFRITGTLGELVIYGTGLNPNGGGGLKLYNEENLSGRDVFPTDRQGAFFLGFRGLWKEINRIVRENDRIAAAKTVEEAAKDVAVALAIYESSKSGTWVTV